MKTLNKRIPLKDWPPPEPCHARTAGTPVLLRVALIAVSLLWLYCVFVTIEMGGWLL